MVCTLCKPDKPTIQQACTTSVQFAVCDDVLDLTVTQRLSDVILGLPHDVIVWSVLLHLVQREVHLRTDGKRSLRAGQLNFCISGGGAHVYDINASSMEQLLQRTPIANVQPYLIMDESCRTLRMTDLARSYGTGNTVLLRAGGYGKDCYHPLMKIEQAVEENTSEAKRNSARHNRKK